jgi:hypothetical protein
VVLTRPLKKPFFIICDYSLQNFFQPSFILFHFFSLSLRARASRAVVCIRPKYLGLHNALYIRVAAIVKTGKTEVLPICTGIPN